MKKDGEKIPLYAMVVPKKIANELISKGIRKVRIIAEIPEVKEEVTTERN
jgi:hypothetical protein